MHSLPHPESVVPGIKRCLYTGGDGRGGRGLGFEVLPKGGL